jgi:malonyl-CoA O-methyltransferase
MLKARVRQAFNQAAASYCPAADVQRRVVQALAERLSADASASVIIDAGCGTGFARSLMLAARPAARILAIDHAEQMLHQYRDGAGARPGYEWIVGGDSERLPLADASADLYWSSLCLQWCHLPSALAEARRVLKPGARILFATVVDETFRELRVAFDGVDAHSHTLDCLTRGDVESSVRAAGFATIEVGSERILALFPDLRTLLRAVRQVGASEVSGPRRRGLLGRAAWQRIENRYAQFRDARGCPLTYDILYVSALA